MLQRGDLLPHFAVRTVDGGTLAYSTIWQRRNLVLLLIGTDPEATNRARSAVESRKCDFATADTEIVITADAIDGLPARGCVIADRWGEIVHMASVGPTTTFPPVDELLEWVSYTQMRCPECEGETK